MEPSRMGIKIKTLDNALFELEISPEMTVNNLKTLIEDNMKVPVPKQRLIFHGKLLADSDKLSKYKIEEGHVIHLVANPIDQNAQQSTPNTENSNTQTQNLTRTSNNSNELDILTGIIRTINQTSLNRRNLRRRLMQQRPRGFNFDIPESLGIINQSFQSISMVVDSATKFSELSSFKNLNKNTFINPFNFSNRKLNLGQWIDVKDTIDQWLEAQVIKLQNNQVLVHYNGWGNRWDEWLDMNSPRIALFRSYTVQTPHSMYMSPNPINQPDGDLDETSERKLEAQDFLFDLGSLLNKITADIIELGKLMNYKKIKENQSNEEKEETKINANDDVPNEVKINVLNSQLAPIFDRVGRLMIDLAPHLALQGSGIQTIYVPAKNNENPIEGTTPIEEPLQKTHVFQVPVMLTPGEILSINNFGDRSSGEGDFPRSTILIGSRSLNENINGNSNINQNTNEEEERNFGDLNENKNENGRIEENNENNVKTLNENEEAFNEKNQDIKENVNEKNQDIKENVEGKDGEFETITENFQKECEVIQKNEKTEEFDKNSEVLSNTNLDFEENEYKNDLKTTENNLN